MLKKLLALLLLLSMAVCNSCVPLDVITCPDHSEYVTEDIVVPSLGDIERERVSLDNIQYSRPDSSMLVSEINALIPLIENGSLNYDELANKISELDEKYSALSTMLTYSMIKNSQNSADEHFAKEYQLLKSSTPEISRAFDELFVALARCEFAEKLEEEVFGKGFVEEYIDGSSYTDSAVALLEREAELESGYSALSTANVEITYKGKTDTFDNTVARLKNELGEGSIRYKQALAECERLYDQAVMNVGCDTFVSLLSVRSLLGKEMGYKSYNEYAYDMLGHDYSEREMKAMLEDIANYAIPVYSALSSSAFAGYFKTHKTPRAHEGKVINDIYNVLSKISPELSESYAYMLNCGLYDIAPAKANRLDGAYTTYLYDIDAPYIFATTSGTVSDYMTISHEFGHFFDSYTNYNSDTSLDLLEISSTALELIVLSKLSDALCDDNYKYLYYDEIKSMLEVLIFQGFYAKFESLVYEIPADRISRQSVDNAVLEAARFMNLNTDYFNSLDDILIYHLIETPFYVQSYCTSAVAALDIFFMECENEGGGVEAYLKLTSRDADKNFTAHLIDAGISSPFRSHAIKDITNKIYYSIIGSYYYGDDAENIAMNNDKSSQNFAVLANFESFCLHFIDFQYNNIYLPEW